MDIGIACRPHGISHTPGPLGWLLVAIADMYIHGEASSGDVLDIDPRDVFEPYQCEKDAVFQQGRRCTVMSTNSE